MSVPAPPPATDPRELRLFIVQLGAALNESGESVDAVQERLAAIARAYGAHSLRVSAFPTQLMVSMGQGEPATLEITAGIAGSQRLDAITELEDVARRAERAELTPAEGLARLWSIGERPPRFGPLVTVLGYAMLTVGVALLLDPAPRDVATAAGFGVIVGLLRRVGRSQSTLQVLMPVVAAFVVSALSAMAVRTDFTGPGLPAIVASLIVFVPGAALTTAVLELAAGQMVSGSSRLVSGVMQLALLTFGILAGIQAVGVPSAKVLSGGEPHLGSWAPWLGVLVFGVGVSIANSAPRRSLLGLLAVLYAAWTGQVIGNAALGAYVSAFVGALAMMFAAFFVARLPRAMPPRAAFLPAFWLLVPGALGLIGLTRFAGDATGAGPHDLVATIVSIFAVALGVLCGTQLLTWAAATGRVVGEVQESLVERRSRWWVRRRRR